MDWGAIGKRIRTQREFMGYTREQFAELLDVTPKFCSDIELGVKGMSVPTLCRISRILRQVRQIGAYHLALQAAVGHQGGPVQQVMVCQGPL